MELQVIPEKSLEKNKDYERTWKDQQGAEKKGQSSWCLSNDSSLMRLEVSVLIDINEEWMTTKKYGN